MSHRLFIALRPPQTLRDALLDTMDGVDSARWQDDDQLHLTLRYIGETETHRADDLAEALGTICFEPFELRIAGTGIFERKGIPRTLWAGVEKNEPLGRLQRRVERVCQSVGIEAEHRKFTPHVTLARLNTASGPVAPWLAQHGKLALAPWTVQEFVLFESELHEEGSIYTPVIRYPATA
ncbi:RNA 2',3'-cyclic phosphodiesterase [Erythrobacter gaetbuli]|uniref:RNA 2',3'-cyclic phosphodiesterase n=1 Tax=Qipengyuania gaetbuli TaxID=266952 RepID=A0A844XZT9_9SPHN|nr:RNA 2',3'-cyclic phosphodiesterase [Qipengyuania gaetbuli]MXO50707.1 RNA 2',3'-cyclic phosphodiesterase [Qipengyuania gaetbuli]